MILSNGGAMSLSIQILDLYDDLSGKQLKDIAQSAPSFVKQAQVAKRDEARALPSDAFALHALTKEGSRLLKFPMHTQADTWLSCAYFEKNAHKLPRQAARIAATHLKVACEKFTLEPNKAIADLASKESPRSNLYVEEMDGLRKVASVNPIEDRTSEGAFALNGRYPLNHVGHVKRASAYFKEHFGTFSPSERREYSQNVLKKASDFGLDTSEEEFSQLQKVAGVDYGDRLEGQINLRRKIVDGDIEATISLEKVANARESIDADKFVNLLSAWDLENGMDRTYGTSIIDPYQATFESHSKEAGYLWEDEGAGLSLTGKELEKAASAKYDKIKGYFGETLANSLKKHGSQIFDSLPSDAKTVIAKIAKGSL